MVKTGDEVMPIQNKHNRRKHWKWFIMIKHPFTKNSAKEEPQGMLNMHENNEGKNPPYFQAYLFYNFYHNIM